MSRVHSVYLLDSEKRPLLLGAYHSLTPTQMQQWNDFMLAKRHVVGSTLVSHIRVNTIFITTGNPQLGLFETVISFDINKKMANLPGVRYKRAYLDHLSASRGHAHAVEEVKLALEIAPWRQRKTLKLPKK